LKQLYIIYALNLKGVFQEYSGILSLWVRFAVRHEGVPNADHHFESNNFALDERTLTKLSINDIFKIIDQN